MRYLIEIMDKRDKDSLEPWSHFEQGEGRQQFHIAMTELESYIRQYPVIEVRIKIEE